MANPIIKIGIRLVFDFTSPSTATRWITNERDTYRRLAERLGPQCGEQPVRVPPMRGVDEDMRGWSFFMILAHNAIVNRSITSTVVQLARGEPLSGPATIDPKKDVMPGPDEGPGSLAEFEQSIDDHLCAVDALPSLRATHTSPHPVFGAFNAHKWHCMFGFHLGLHSKQAEAIAKILGV